VMLRTHPRRLRRLAGVVAGLSAMAAVLVAGSSPAQALTCVTPGHAYVTAPGVVFFSGYNGDERFGVPRVVVQQGDRVRVGGNGIKPGTDIAFRAVRSDGRIFNFFPGQLDYLTAPARDNCVVHEEGPFEIVAPPGMYRVVGVYQPGNQPIGVTDPVVDFEVRRGPITASVPQSADDTMFAPVPPGDGGGGGGGGGGGCEPLLPCTV